MICAPSRSSWAPSVTFVAPGTDDWEFFLGGDYIQFNSWHGSGSEIEVPGESLGAQEVALQNTFRNHTQLKKVVLSDNTTQLWGAFEGCTALQSITIPASVTWISDGCFTGCTSLRSVVLERDSELYSIPANAFQGCTDVTFYGYGKNNAAYWFTVQNGYPYVDLDHCLIGDADGNGIVDLLDVSTIQYHLADFYVPVEPAVIMCGDVDGNGKTEITDTTYIQRFIADMETPYAVGKMKE